MQHVINMSQKCHGAILPLYCAFLQNRSCLEAAIEPMKIVDKRSARRRRLHSFVGVRRRVNVHSLHGFGHWGGDDHVEHDGQYTNIPRCQMPPSIRRVPQLWVPWPRSGGAVLADNPKDKIPAPTTRKARWTGRSSGRTR